ncbi:MAG: DUF4321 domain-containing protein [Ruminococcus sp.]|nr:DUF4321 domain-containing protein [Ruminococcus sp.]MDE7226315.1 DUF4321 domain-containing protein [Ruminococcus sp.]
MKKLYMIFLIATAIVTGSMIGNMFIGTEGLSWLGYTKPLNYIPGTFEILGVLELTFGIYFSLNIAQIMLIITAIVVYYKTSPKLFPK